MYVLRSRGVLMDPPGVCVRGAVVAVEGDRILFVGSDKEFARAFTDVECQDVDLSNYFLSPGLINTHVHLAFSGQTNPREDYLREGPGMRVLRALHNAQVLLNSGVTTARDCGSDFIVLEGLREAMASGFFVLPTLLLCGPPITQTGGHLHFMGGEVDGPDAIRQFVRLLHKRGASSIKVMATGGQMTPGTHPERPAFSQTELEALTETARDLGLPTASHCLSSVGTVRSARAGFDSIEHCAFFEREEHGWLRRVYDPSVTEEIIRHHNSVMMGLSAGYHKLDAARESGERTPHEMFLLEQERNMFAIFREMREAGVPMIAGTDAGVEATPFDETWFELELMVKAGLPALEAVRAATTRAARALRIDGITGRIAAGMRADLVAVRDDPTIDVGTYRRVDWLMCRGHVIRTFQSE